MKKMMLLGAILAMLVSAPQAFGQTATYTAGEVTVIDTVATVPFQITSTDTIWGSVVTLWYDPTKVDFKSVSTPMSGFTLDAVNDNQHVCPHPMNWITVLITCDNLYSGSMPGTNTWLNFTFRRVTCGQTALDFPVGNWCEYPEMPNVAAIRAERLGRKGGVDRIEDGYNWIANNCSTVGGLPLTYGPPYNNITVDDGTLTMGGCTRCPPDCQEEGKPGDTAVAPAVWGLVKGLYR